MGPPNPNLKESMEREHCEEADSKIGASQASRPPPSSPTPVLQLQLSKCCIKCVL